MTSQFNQLPARNWIHATLGGIKRPARYLDDQASAAVQLAGTVLFPGSQR